MAKKAEKPTTLEVIANISIVTGKPPSGPGKEDGRKTTAPGKPVTLPTEFAENLIKRGHARLPSAETAAPVDGAPIEIGPVKPEGADLGAAIMDAIAGLDVNEDFTGGGKPNVASLEKALGYDIFADDRDHAWDAYQKKNPDLFKQGGGGEGGTN